MGNKLDGRVALILGGTRGIGAAISRRLVADGASVALLYLNRTEQAVGLVADLKAAGGSALSIRADISDATSLSGAMDEAFRYFGRLDILVNSAGLGFGSELQSYPEDAFDRIFAVNVRAPFLAAQKVSTVMPDGGRIITIGSIVADRVPSSGVTLYAASKSALGGLTRGLARDLGPRRITVNLVQPGPVDTERNPADGPDAEANRAPLAIQRHGRADEVASLVAYLASDAASFITGSTYNIDGGWAA